MYFINSVYVYYINSTCFCKIYRFPAVKFQNFVNLATMHTVHTPYQHLICQGLIVMGDELHLRVDNLSYSVKLRKQYKRLLHSINFSVTEVCKCLILYMFKYEELFIRVQCVP